MIFNDAPGFGWTYTHPGARSSYSSCNTDSPATTYGVRNIATHKLGHFLAPLDDLYRAPDAPLTIPGEGATGELQKDRLGYVDCRGITAACGGSC